MSLSAYRNLDLKRTICLLMVMAFLSSALIHTHFHLQHADEISAEGSFSDTHEAVFHSSLDSHDVDHHLSDPGTHTVESKTDIALKASNGQLPFVALILALVLLLPLSNRTVNRPHVSVRFNLPRLYRHRTPPLRAPPLN
ncbi:MAG: hypothetical protein KZQ93_15295 [Candidatus Thiodiazotropha sp. (ex Monitilora ramsayi)]|nr:hypothetical protein [Candidatus Thiodiazotropha sp. (ex Monitilora ramsayi)]